MPQGQSSQVRTAVASFRFQSLPAWPLWRAPGSRFPAVGRRLPFWQFPRHLSLLPGSMSLIRPVPLPLQMTNDKGPMTVVPHS